MAYSDRPEGAWTVLNVRTGFHRGVAGAVLLLAGALAAPTPAADTADVPLVWHVESAGGEVLDTRRADAPLNPASLVKVATSAWALERLGPEHRFETGVLARGEIDASTGVLDGDLLVRGGADPDFHVENAFRVAEALNRSGIRVVRGKLRVDERFWIGWEGGSPSELTGRRARTMALRLRDALDPSRWDRETERLVREFVARVGFEGDTPRVVVEGGVGTHSGETGGAPLLLHRSNPLRQTLKRLNAFSNNDIERLGAVLGSADDLTAGLAGRWGDDAPLRLKTLSGLGANRMTARLVVRMMRELDATCEEHELETRDILPIAGCDPGTLEKFPHFADRANRALVAKTGTLAHTDGGIAVLAGIAYTESGPVFFCVAAPKSGTRLAEARRSEERWVLKLFERLGGPRPVGCGAAVGYSDDDIRLETADD